MSPQINFLFSRKNSKFVLQNSKNMEVISVRSKFHQLIDKVENIDLLERFYQSFSSAVEQKKGAWQTLSDVDKNHILESYDESFDENNLLNHEDVKAKYSKWLTK